MADRGSSERKSALSQARAHARWVIQDIQKALKKHIGLVKKRERIMNIVAMIEQLRGDIRSADVRTIRRHLKKIDDLTKGFAKRVLKRRMKAKTK